ncbi:ChtB2 [Spodoptera eridania nucleopolyhedrovirus]|uniref:ChtB2 n=1 Tax=Spodoptera eridania nucleopolyhedrovirus TaxID=2315721 RepID=A0A346TQ09_9ABAC|nr:ChtB2 [Spodoptera eridania nucleopolyhedrovirus]AXU41669.1 ChtB2 [Spodoptera eridania nucleopolyhedrovirus]
MNNNTMMKYLLIITIILIVILLFLYTIQSPKRKQVRYIPHENYTDTFLDTHTNQIKLCPNKCPVFNFEKQKCVKGTVTTNVCKVGVFGNVPHYYRCNAFYLCSGGVATRYTCSINLCFNETSRTCVHNTTNQCACITEAPVCSDCCDDEGNNELL